MEINWRKVGASLNGRAMTDLDISNDAENPETAREFRIRGAILYAIAQAIFDGLPEEPKSF